MIGGAAVMTQNLAEEWARMDHNVDVITSSYPGAAKKERLNGVNVFRANTFSKDPLATVWSAGFYLWNGFWRSFFICLKNKPDLINSHFAVPAGVIGVILSRVFKIKHALTVIGADIYEPSRKLSPHKNKFLRFLVRWVINNSDVVTAISTNIKEMAVKYYNPRKEIIVVPVGLKTQKFNKVSRKDLGLSENKIYLISIGVFLPRKNFKTLIEAFSKIEQKNVQLLLIGDGPLKPELEKLVKNLNIKDKVLFLGAVSNEKKFQYLSVSDIFALLSVHEGFGIVYQEAMFCGPAIIASDEGGQKDFLINNQNALLVKFDDIDGITNALKKMSNDSDFRKTLSVNAKSSLEGYYIDNVASKYLTYVR